MLVAAGCASGTTSSAVGIGAGNTTPGPEGGSESSETDPAGGRPGSLDCDADFEQIVELLGSGLPTYDYEPAMDLASLVERVDVVVEATIVEVERVVASEAEERSRASTEFTVKDLRVLSPADGSVEPLAGFSMGSWWGDRDRSDPLLGPVVVDELRAVAFLHAWPDASSGYEVDVQGLAVGCDDGAMAAAAIIQPLPISGTIADLADAVLDLAEARQSRG